MEAEALLQVQPHRLAVVAVVADRQVLARLEQEVATPPAQNQRAADARGPHDRTLEDRAQVLEQWVAALLGGLSHALVLLAA